MFRMTARFKLFFTQYICFSSSSNLCILQFAVVKIQTSFLYLDSFSVNYYIRYPLINKEIMFNN